MIAKPLSKKIQSSLKPQSIMKFLIFVLLSISFKQIHSGGPQTSFPAYFDPSFSTDLQRPNGIYIKSIILVALKFPYSSAQEACVDNDMDLLKLSDEYTYNSFINYLTSVWDSNSVFWVNGVKDESGEWHTQPGNGPIFVKWVGNSTSGDCLSIIKGDENIWGASSYACEADNLAWCEFDKLIDG